MKDTGPAGHCQICERLIMFNEQTAKLAKHGYERPGNGWLVGMCTGAEHRPYEKAKDRLAVYREIVTTYIDREQTYLARLQAGEITRLRDTSVYTKQGELPPEIDPSAWNWDMMLRGAIQETQYKIRKATDELARVDKRIADWKPNQPLSEKGKSGMPMVMRINVGETYTYGERKVEVLSKPHTVLAMGRRTYDGVKVRREDDAKEFIVRARSLKPIRKSK